MIETFADCRSDEGITTGAIDAMITLARLLRGRDLSPQPVQQALMDLTHDEDIKALLEAGRKHWIQMKVVDTLFEQERLIEREIKSRNEGHVSSAVRQMMKPGTTVMLKFSYDIHPTPLEVCSVFDDDQVTYRIWSELRRTWFYHVKELSVFQDWYEAGHLLER